MPQDANRPLVFGSKLVGVPVVIPTLVTRQAELRSARPAGDKNQIAAHPDQNGDYGFRSPGSKNLAAVAHRECSK
jgi:hypothetical protein